jgi:hypothetical protein
MIWPLVITIVTTPHTHDPDTLREDGIIESRTSTRSTRSSRHINPSSLNEKSVNIGLSLYKDLTNCNTIWINDYILARKSKGLDLLIIIVLYSS